MELNAKHLFFWLEWDVDLEHEEVRFPILVSVLLLDLKSEQTSAAFNSFNMLTEFTTAKRFLFPQCHTHRDRWDA